MSQSTRGERRMEGMEGWLEGWCVSGIVGTRFLFIYIMVYRLPTMIEKLLSG